MRGWSGSNNWTHRLLAATLGAVLAWLFLLSPNVSLSHWQQIKLRGELIWGTRPSLLTYFSTPETKAGLEYLLLKQFARAHNIELNVLELDSNTALLHALDNREIDLAGAHLTLTPQRREKYHHSLPYNQSMILAVGNRNTPRVGTIEDLSGLSGRILGASSYAEEFLSLPNHRDWNVSVVDDSSTFEIIQDLLSGDFDYTFADSNLVQIYQKYLPGLRVLQPLGQSQDVVFLSSQSHDDSLILQLNEFIEHMRKNGFIERMLDDINIGLPNLAVADSVTFLYNYNTHWPEVSDYFYRVAEQHGLNPALLGAIAYQESHWKPKAVSVTGVRGLMMLTRRVAKEMGVKDRTNPLQSVEGGARYFLNMLEKIPDRIAEPDKTYLALAAYNIGYGHLEEARRLTQGHGKDPDKWDDVKSFLPMLNDKKLEDALKFGNADGETAVVYVENIITYKNLLQWKERNRLQ